MLKPSKKTPHKPNRRGPRGPAIVPKRRATGPVLLLAVALTAPTVNAAAGEMPATAFVMKNRAPFAALIGVPGRWPDTTGSFGEFSWNAASHAMTESRDGTTVLTDGETHSLTARIQADAGRLRFGAQLPWISHSGGFLDSTIDAWHEFFGLPEGIRPNLDQDQLSYIVQRQGTDLYRLDEPVSGIGDLQLGMSVELGSFAKHAQPGTISGYFRRIPWRLSLNLKLPTGDIDKLTGSGAVDYAIGIGWRAPGRKPRQDTLVARSRPRPSGRCRHRGASIPRQTSCTTTQR